VRAIRTLARSLSRSCLVVSLPRSSRASTNQPTNHISKSGMRFISTRGQCPQVSFEEAVLQGYAPDGGLYVPERIPTLTPEQLAHLATLSFCELAVEILSLFIEAHEIPRDDLVALVHKSYASFRSEQVVC